MTARHYPDHLSTCGVDFRGCDPKCPFLAAADKDFDSYARERLMCWHDGGLMYEIDDLLSDIKLARRIRPLPLKLIKAIRGAYPSALTEEETNRFFNKVELPANHLPTCGKTFPQRCVPGCPFAATEAEAEHARTMATLAKNNKRIAAERIIEDAVDAMVWPFTPLVRWGCADDYDCALAPHPEGDYVEYSDHVLIVAALERALERESARKHADAAGALLQEIANIGPDVDFGALEDRILEFVKFVKPAPDILRCHNCDCIKEVRRDITWPHGRTHDPVAGPWYCVNCVESIQ